MSVRGMQLLLLGLAFGGALGCAFFRTNPDVGIAACCYALIAIGLGVLQNPPRDE